MNAFARKPQAPFVPYSNFGPRDFLWVGNIKPRSTRVGALPPCPPQARQIVIEVLEKHNQTWQTVYGATRFKPVVDCRHELFYRLHSELGWSFAAIGRFTNKDHTTVLHAMKKYELGRLFGLEIASNLLHTLETQSAPGG